jgi:hypothetical protein
LQEFLFGSERESLKVFVPILTEIQKDECFYCGGRMNGEPIHVDHFIPWSRYPVDLGHNFVLAHARPCNATKSDRLASFEHLSAWVTRNGNNQKALATEFDARGITHDLPTSFQIARWAYGQIESSNGLTWLKGDELVHLRPGWVHLFPDPFPAGIHL